MLFNRKLMLLEALAALVPAALLVGQLFAPAVGQETTTTTLPLGAADTGQIMMAAALAIAATGFGAGIGMGIASAAAVGAVAEKPEVFGRTILYVVFIEAIAIYGLVISFTIITKAP